MNLPKHVHIGEEGPREGFQIESADIPTAHKVELIEALAETGLQHIQCVSFVNPKRVPGMADAGAVAAAIRRKNGVMYTSLWLNDQGMERATQATNLDLEGSIGLTASETFLMRNQGRTLKENFEAQHDSIRLAKQLNVPIEMGAVLTAFGCNFEGDIPVSRVIEVADQIMALSVAHDLTIKTLMLADTMGWATPLAVKRVVGAVRERYPDISIKLHLHDTRGMGIANAYAGLEMGVDDYDSAIAGLGGCPFAAHKGAAGNVCTEDLVFMLDEMGIETGINLDKLIEAAHLAEKIVGCPLPGSVMRGGSLTRLRAARAQAMQA